MNNNWIGICPFIKNINPKCQTMKYIHFEQSFIGVEYICIIFQSLSRSGCLDGFIGNTPCPYQSYGRNWTLICDCRKESCNVTMWSMQGKIFKFRIINRLSKLNRWMEYMYIMKIFVETTVPTQMTSYYLSSRAISLLTTLKVVYETSNVYNATYPDNVDIMHFPKHIWLFCLKYKLFVRWSISL